MRIYSYVVRYDSGFAPNPFYETCTLATCKPDIRKSAVVGDWIVGCGSSNRSINQGGRLVYAMEVTESLTFEEYDADPRFYNKRPYRFGSRKQSSGDNIYSRDHGSGNWVQLDSFHSRDDGTPNPDHVLRDTKVNRVLISKNYIYFGGGGPYFPDHLQDSQGRSICTSGKRAYSCYDEPELIASFLQWVNSLGSRGYRGEPFEWSTLRKRS